MWPGRQTRKTRISSLETSFFLLGNYSFIKVLIYCKFRIKIYCSETVSWLKVFMKHVKIKKDVIVKKLYKKSELEIVIATIAHV